MIKILGKKSTFITMTSLIIFSLCCGYLIDFMKIIPINILTQEHSHVHGETSILPIITSVFLIIIILNTFFTSYFAQTTNRNINLSTISVTGMTCDHCIKTVNDVIQSLGGKNININLEKSTAEFSGNVDFDKLKEKIISLGYKIEI